MQVEREVKKFEPIIITLESAKEVLELYATVAHTTGATVKRGLEDIGVAEGYDLFSETLVHEKIYYALKPYIEEAKDEL